MHCTQLQDRSLWQVTHQLIWLNIVFEWQASGSGRICLTSNTSRREIWPYLIMDVTQLLSLKANQSFQLMRWAERAAISWRNCVWRRPICVHLTVTCRVDWGRTIACSAMHARVSELLRGETPSVTRNRYRYWCPRIDVSVWKLMPCEERVARRISCTNHRENSVDSVVKRARTREMLK